MTIAQIPDTNGGRAGQLEPATFLPSATLKEIPYDFVARFQLEGRAGNRVQDVINVSTDGAFVAVAIGYSFIPAPLPDPVTVGGASVARLTTPPPSPAAGSSIGLDRLVNLTSSFFEDRRLLSQALARLLGIDFLYTIVDSATGRELQNVPIHNIAGLGEPNGRRPFRPMAQPMLFMPRSTIRIEVQEESEGQIYGYVNSSGRQENARLFIVLHGYKILGYGTGVP
jgi:hypothetical protein